jgi:cytochrome c1
MSSSLRFLLILLAAGFVAGTAALVLNGWQRHERTRIFAEAATSGNVDAGQQAMGRYGCGSCHEIPGIEGAAGKVGPSLADFAKRTEIAGHLANDPANLIVWLRTPQSVSPGNGMPNQSVSEIEARDMSAFLYSLN